jgi:osmotically-inducible protein OsmY
VSDQAGTGPPAEDPYYLEARVQRRLAEDPDTAELGVRVAVHGEVVHLSGDVASDERRRQLVEAAAAEAVGREVRDDLRVTGAEPPAGAEDLTGGRP